jgi:enoyl-CoA hydratase/carnithine racemase
MSLPVRFAAADGIATLTLAQPERRNALSRPLLAALRDALQKIAPDAGVRVVVLDALGPAFSAGHDLRELTGAPPADAESLFALCTEVMQRIRALPQPVIAAVQGIATAAGCQLVASCDLAVAAAEATFATPGVKIGLFCSTPAVALGRAVPAKQAMEMLLTGEAISATEAERLGLVNRVVPGERLQDEVMGLARKIAGASRSTVALGKRTFYAQAALGLSAAYAVAQQAMVENTAMADAQEGMSAFLEKRPPRWTS